MERKNGGRGRARTSTDKGRGAAAGRGDKKSYDRKPTGNRKFSDDKPRRSSSPRFGSDRGDSGKTFSSDRRVKKDFGDKPFSKDRKPYSRFEEKGERGGGKDFSSDRRVKKDYGDKLFSKERKPYSRFEERPERGSTPRSSTRRFDSKGKPFGKPSFRSRDNNDRGARERKFSDRRSDSRDERGSNSRFEKREERRSNFHADKKRFSSDDKRPFKKQFSDSKPEFRGKQELREDGRLAKRPKKAYDKNAREEKFDSNPEQEFRPVKRFEKREETSYSKGKSKSGYDKKFKGAEVAFDGSSRLNKYVANSGICSRREADDLIQAGLVSVNGVTITELGTKVNPGDVVKYNGETIRNEKHRYVLLNKPKDFITTTEDPEDRRTVMTLIEGACKERIYPVGRLDRNTTGVLLFTNDGDLAKKLTHPSYEIHKIYHVELDKNLKQTDLEKIREGLQLEDGFIKVDDIQYDASFDDKKQIGVEIHSGKNRIVRRIFESLDYSVIKLDRVIFAGLTKKDVPRGRYRLLTELEVSTLKMATSKIKKVVDDRPRFKKKLVTDKKETTERPRVKRKTSPRK